MPDLRNQQGTFTPPSQLDEFQVERPLGRGANGQVYLAKDTVLERPVALKFLSGRKLSRHARRRFLVEARAIARLKHPNVVTVYRFGETMGRPYLVSEYVSGQSLARMIKPIAWQRALEIGAELARGLAAAHQQGVLHRDIKPANVMISDVSEVKLLDFGLAKLSGLLGEPDWVRHASSSEDQTSIPKELAFEPTIGAAEEKAGAEEAGRVLDETLPAGIAPKAHKAANDRLPHGGPREPIIEPLTRAGAVLGTPAYMAPEAWQGLPATPMTDVYSLGAVLYEMCTGRPPHYSSNVSQIEHDALHEDVPQLAEQVADIDGRFATLVDRCLRRNPAERPQSGMEVQQELDSLLRPSLASLILKGLRLRWPLVVLALLVLMGSSLGSTYYLAQHSFRQKESPVLKARTVVAVLGPVTEASSQADAWYASAISELLSRELGLGERLRVVASPSVQRMLQESQIRENHLYDAGTLLQIHRRLDAAVVVTGSYQLHTEGTRRIQLSFVAQDTQTGQTLARSTVTGPTTEVFDLVAQVAQILRKQLGLGDRLTVQKTGLRVANPDTLKRYGEALQELRGFRLLRAGELLSRVVSDDPDFSPAYEALATVWRSLGYDVKAREALRHAMEHTTGLQREELLRLDARRWESLKDWDRAFSAYETLMRLFPDNPEYPLALGEAQLSAGKHQEALATLTRMQDKNAGALLDPRVDAAIARALEDNGDFRAAHSRYQTAIDKSVSIGASLLVARCLVSQAYVKKYLGEANGVLPNLDQAIQIFRRAGAQLDVADALAAKGWILRDRGDAQHAFETFHDALAILIEAGSGNGTAIHLGNVALLLLRMGELPLATARAEASLVLAREVDYKEASATAQLSLGWIALHRTELLRVEQRIAAAERTASELDDNLLSAWLLWLSAESQLLRGNLVQAEQKHEQALQLRTLVGSSGFVAESRVALAYVALLDERAEDARSFAEQALPLFRSDGQRDGETFALAVQSAALAQQKKEAEALALAAQTEALNRDNPYLPMRATVLCTLARTYAALAKPQHAEHSLEQIQRLLSDPRLAELRTKRIELQLAQARLRLLRGRTPETLAGLRAIQQESQQAGFLLAAQEAARLSDPQMNGGHHDH